MAISEDISEPLARLLKPCKAQPGDESCSGSVEAEGQAVWCFAPYEHIACLLDGWCERVEVEQKRVFRRQGGYRVEDGRQEHERRSDDVDNLRHISQIHAKRSQQP